MVERHGFGDIVEVLPRLEPTAVDVVITYASANMYTAQAAKEAGWTAASAERIKRTRRECCIPFCAVCSGDVRVHRQGSVAVCEPPGGHRC